jgi:hypothetical protein
MVGIWDRLSVVRCTLWAVIWCNPWWGYEADHTATTEGRVPFMPRNGEGMNLVFMEVVLFWPNHHYFGFIDSEPRSLLANARYVSSVFDYVVKIYNRISSDFFLPPFPPSSLRVSARTSRSVICSIHCICIRRAFLSLAVIYIIFNAEDFWHMPRQLERNGIFSTVVVTHILCLG